MEQLPNLIIAGAGISGLMAAYLLSDKMNITIVEAQPLPGGRISTIVVNGQLVERGPEFVHGDASVSVGLLKQAGLELEKIAGESYKKENGRLVKEEQQEGGDWEMMLEKMKGLKDDMALGDFLDQHFPLPDHDQFQQEVRSFAEGFDVADPAIASTKALYEEWSHESGDDHRIKKGYGALVQWMTEQLEKSGVKFIYNTKVSSVNWNNNHVQVTTQNGMILEASSMLITIPVSLLAQTDHENSIHFHPDLPDHREAASHIGFGNVVKIACWFTEKCWPEDAGFLIGNEYFRAWWTPLPDTKPMITGWVGGPKATAIIHNTEEEILAKALQSLSQLTGTPEKILRSKLVHHHISAQKHHTMAGGAYSFATLASASAKEVLNTPVADTLYFAGEALYSGPHPGTVEAALVSAKEIVKKINN